jgi:hypothetical protein
VFFTRTDTEMYQNQSAIAMKAPMDLPTSLSRMIISLVTPGTVSIANVDSGTISARSQSAR